FVDDFVSGFVHANPPVLYSAKRRMSHYAQLGRVREATTSRYAQRWN
ncbi:MAG: hypothetical protein ACI8W7_002923, partial [Gammaproteobacteria bacterium]